MKRVVNLIFFIFISSIKLTFLSAEILDDETKKAVDAFTKAYKRAYPDIAIKQGLIVLDIKNIDSLAKDNKIGETVKSYLEDNIKYSLVFYLIDRDNLKSILKEIELGQTGLISEDSAVKAGKLIGAKILIDGKITYINSNFHVILKLIETETGKVMSTYSFDIEKSLMIHSAIQLQYSYIMKYGIGISTGLTFFFTPSKLINKGIFFNNSEGHYRLSRKIMLGAGIMSSLSSDMDNYRYDGDNLKYKDLQPELPALIPSGRGGVFEATNTGPTQYTGDVSMNIMHLDIQYNFNFSPKFNIGINGGVVFVNNPSMKYTVSYFPAGIYYRSISSDTNGNYFYTPQIDPNPLTYIFNSGIGGKIEIKSEYFIFPRLAFRISLGYIYLPTLKIREVKATHATWEFYEYGDRKEIDSSTWEYDPDNLYDDTNNTASYVYYGFNPTKRPDGKRFELNLSNIYIEISASFFF